MGRFTILAAVVQHQEMLSMEQILTIYGANHHLTRRSRSSGYRAHMPAATCPHVTGLMSSPINNCIHVIQVLLQCLCKSGGSATSNKVKVKAFFSASSS
jgi:hypothetical protein